MFEHARLLFMEEWLLSVVVLAALFVVGYGLWRLKQKAARPAATRKTHSTHQPAKTAGAQEAAPGPTKEREPADPGQLDRLASAMQSVLEAPKEEQPQPPTPEPSREVAELVEEGLQGLDSFGLTFQKMRVFNDPNASLQQISQAITSDLVFSGKVLKSANSPYFGAPAEVSSLHHAVLVLGLNNLKTLYFQDHFRMVGRETGHMAQVRETVWKHSISTAICASYLCKAFGLVPSETAFTLGLLHDLGKLALADMAEQLAATGDELPEYDGNWPVAQEQQLLGVDHAWVGRQVALKWNLPKDVAMVIGGHHSLQLDATPAPSDAAKAQMVTLVLANHLAHALLEPESELRPMPAAIFGKLHDEKRLVQLVRDQNLLDELQMARVLR